MKIAITGAAGLVGNNLCRALLQQGHEVRALIYKDKKSLEDLAVEIVEGDVQNLDSLLSFCEGIDVLFHCAAKISIDGDRDQQVELTNVRGTQNVIEACLAKKVGRLIHFSSIHALVSGAKDEEINEESAYAAGNAFKYDLSKSKSEQLVMQAVAERGLDAVIINPTGVIGPNDFKPSLTGQLLLDLYHNSMPCLVHGGYDFVDVRDVVSAAINAMQGTEKGSKYLITGRWYKVKEIAEAVERIGGQKGPKLVLPIWVAKLGLPFIMSYSRISGTAPLYTIESLEILTHGTNINGNKARKELGHDPRGLDETIKDSLDWFRAAGFLKK